MKNSILTLAIMALSTVVFAQNNPVDFEAGGIGSDWTWEVFENGDNPPVDVIANPDASGANTSDSVASITVRADGASFAGAITRDIGTFTLDETNRTISIMVWKSKISDVGIKLETASGFAFPEIKVANTVVDQWEELTFDFSGVGNPPSEPWNGLTIFPDFGERTEDATIYFDNITFSDEQTGGGGGGTGAVVPTEAAPTPTVDAADVISIFSDAYVDIATVNVNPDWGQATQFSFTEFGTDSVLTYTGLNYQGIDFGTNVDVSGMNTIHIDYWTSNSTALNFYLISPGPVEAAYALPVPTDGWNSLDIDLSTFAGVDLTSVFQFKFDGNGDFSVDNLYFSSANATSIDRTGGVPDGFTLNQNYPNPFNPTTNISYNLPTSGRVTLDVFNMQGQRVATLVNNVQNAGTYSVTFDASNLASGVYTYRLVSGNSVQVKKMLLIK